MVAMPLDTTPGPLDDVVLAERYRVRGTIARGGMADVHLAEDTVLHRAVAVKVFRAGTADPVRFQNETMLMAQLQHPNLVRLFDAGDHLGSPFLVI